MLSLLVLLFVLLFVLLSVLLFESLLVLLSVGVFLLSSSLGSSSFFSTITFLSAVALLPALSETVYFYANEKTWGLE